MDEDARSTWFLYGALTAIGVVVTTAVLFAWVLTWEV